MHSIDNSDNFSDYSDNNSKRIPGKLRTKSTFGGNSMLLEANEKAFRQQLFEMNNYPKSLLMTDKNLDIIFYNNNICQSLLYDKYELLEVNICRILQIKNTTEMQEHIYEIFERILE